MGSRVERPNRVPGVPLCIFEAELAVVTGSQPEGIQRTVGATGSEASILSTQANILPQSLTPHIVRTGRAE